MFKIFVVVATLSLVHAPPAHGQEKEVGGPVTRAVAPGVLIDPVAIDGWAERCFAKPASCDRHKYEVRGFPGQYELEVSNPSSYANLKKDSPFRKAIVKVHTY